MKGSLSCLSLSFHPCSENYNWDKKWICSLKFDLILHMKCALFSLSTCFARILKMPARRLQNLNCTSFVDSPEIYKKFHLVIRDATWYLKKSIGYDRMVRFCWLTTFWLGWGCGVQSALVGTLLLVMLKKGVKAASGVSSFTDWSFLGLMIIISNQLFESLKSIWMKEGIRSQWVYIGELFFLKKIIFWCIFSIILDGDC